MTDFNVHLNATDNISPHAASAKKALNDLNHSVVDNSKQWEILRKAQEREEAQQRKTIQAQEEQSRALQGLGLRLAAVNAAFAVTVRGAAEQRRTQDQLAASLDNVGIKYGDVREQVEGLIKAQQNKTGVSDEEQRESLRLLLVQLGDYDKALQALPVALDTAATTGQSLRETTLQVGKSLAGVTPTVESLGLKFEETADFADRLATLQKRVGGQAEASATPLAKMAAAASDIGDAIGTAMLPVFESLSTGLQILVPLVEAIPAPLIQTLGVIAGGAGLVVGLALLRNEMGKLVKALQSLTIWQTVASGGFAGVAKAIGGALVAGTLVYTITELEGSLGAAKDTGGEVVTVMKDMAKFSGEAAKGIDATAGAAERLTGTSERAEKNLQPFVQAMEDLLIATGRAPDAAGAAQQVVESFGILSEIDLGTPYQQMARFNKQIEDSGELWSMVTPELRDAAIDSIAAMLQEIGVGAKQIEEAGGDVRAAMTKALADPTMTAEMVDSVDDTINGLRVKFADLGLAALVTEEAQAVVESVETELEPLPDAWSFAGLKSREGLTGEMEKAQEDVPLVVEALVGQTVAKAEELIPAFERVGAALPEALVVGINRTINGLEFAFNSVMLPYLAETVDGLNNFASSIGSAQPFPGFALPGPLDLPEVPALARGSLSFPGGVALVGDRGPELVNLPQGAQVSPAHQLAAMLSRYSAAQGSASLLDTARGPGPSSALGSPSTAPVGALGFGSSRQTTFYGPVNVMLDRGHSMADLDLLVRA